MTVHVASFLEIQLIIPLPLHLTLYTLHLTLNTRPPACHLSALESDWNIAV